MVFRPLRHRQINGDGHKMLRESRGDHRRLSFLTILFHFRVTRTGSEVEQSNTHWDIVRVLSLTAKHNLQVVHFFQILW